MKRVLIFILLLILVGCKSAPESSMLSESGTVEPSGTNDYIERPGDTNEAPPIIDDIPVWSPDTIYRDSLEIKEDGTMQQFDGLIFRCADETGTIIKEAWIEFRRNAQGWGSTYLCYAGGWEYEFSSMVGKPQGYLRVERAGKRFEIVIRTNATMTVYNEHFNSPYEVYRCVLWTR